MRQDRNTTFESVAIRECPIDGIDRKKRAARTDEEIQVMLPQEVANWKA